MEPLKEEVYYINQKKFTFMETLKMEFHKVKH